MNLIWLLMSLILGIFPQSLYFMLFITNIKEIKSKRALFTFLIFIICAVCTLIVQYNLYLYLLIIVGLYFATKLLYKKKTQIIDIFIISFSFCVMMFISYICSRPCKSNIDLYWICYIINNIILFISLLPRKFYKKIYKAYCNNWNRKEGNKIKSITLRNISLISLNILILIIDVFLIHISF